MLVFGLPPVLAALLPGVDLESEVAEDGSGVVLAAFEVTGAEGVGGGELVGCSENGVGGVVPAVPGHEVGSGGAEAVPSEEFLRAELVVFADRAFHVSAGDRAP